MPPIHCLSVFSFMLIRIASPFSFDEPITKPHSALPHFAIRTVPLPSVCQSPIGESATSSSASCETLTTGAGDRTGSTGLATGGGGGGRGMATCGIGGDGGAGGGGAT